MDQVIAWMATQHDPRLTLLATLVCLAGVGTTFRLTRLADAARGRRRIARFVIGAGFGGVTLWATHVLGMLAYSPGLPVQYSLSGTLIALSIALAGVGSALFIIAQNRTRTTLTMAGALIGASAAAMDFVGMAAMRTAGRLSWDPALATLAVVTAVSLLSLALAILHEDGFRRRAFAAVLATLAICGMQVIAMAALTIVPDPTVILEAGDSPQRRIVVLVAVMFGFVVFSGSLTALLSFWSRSAALSQLRAAIDAMPDGLGFYDADDRLVIWNTRYGEVNPEVGNHLRRGLTFREIVQVGLADGLYPDAIGRESEWLEARMASRQQKSCTLEQHVSGDRWLRVEDRGTSQGGVVTVVSDITDLKRVTHDLALARDAAEAANQAKSDFLANMSHEIRTPLNGVIGVTQVLARTPLKPAQREMLALIQASSSTLQTLLSDILDLARIESGNIGLRAEALDLAATVHEAAELYAASARDKGLAFTIDVAPDAALWVEGDSVRLKQILTNLVSNAVKFTTSGSIALTVARGPRTGLKPTLRFTVRDTGVGFDAKAKARLFDRFEQADATITRRFGGSGLGLAICGQLADMMDGQLECESEPGRGSAFTLILPLKEVEPSAHANEPADPTEVRDDVRVLVADDHPTNRKVVELMLEQVGVTLHQVENGAEAVEAARGQTFDVILMDMQMPVMDGLTATRAIRLHETAAGLRRTPIVMLTANALPEHVAASEAAGSDRHLAKPFNAADLIALIAELSSPGRNSLAA